jgi:hypothetical protein
MVHLPTEPSICDRCDRFRRSRSAIGRRPRMDHTSCPGRHQGAGWHPLQAYRAIVDLAPVVAISLFQSCRSALHPKALRARSAAHPSKRHPLDLASRRLSPYRSRASAKRKLPGIRHTIIRYRAQSHADHNSFTAIAPCIGHDNPKHCKKLAPKSRSSKPVATWRSRRHSAIADKAMRNDRCHHGHLGQSYEKRQVPPRSSR